MAKAAYSCLPTLSNKSVLTPPNGIYSIFLLDGLNRALGLSLLIVDLDKVVNAPATATDRARQPNFSSGLGSLLSFPLWVATMEAPPDHCPLQIGGVFYNLLSKDSCLGLPGGAAKQAKTHCEAA